MQGEAALAPEPNPGASAQMEATQPPEPRRDKAERVASPRPAQGHRRRTNSTGSSSVESARLRQNLRRTLWMAFFKVFLVIMPVAVPFFQSKGLSMGEVFSLQALFAFVVMVAEVPSGYLADLIGRRRCLVLGALFCGIGHSLLLTAEGFWTLALFEIALGLSHSLVSGADLALLYDTEIALGRGRRRQLQVVGKLYSVQTLSEAIAGVLCSLLLLWWSMTGVVLAQVVVGWLPLAFALRLAEPPAPRLASDSHAANMARILRHLLAGSQVLRLTFLALCIWGLTTFHAVWLLPKLWQQQGIGLAHFGYLWAGLFTIGAVAGRLTPKVEERIGTTSVLLFIGLAPALGYLGLQLLGIIGGVIAAAFFFVARGLGIVLLTNALNSRVPSEFRATANSLASLGFRGTFVLTGPLVGWAFDLWGMATTLWMLTAACLVVFASLVLPLLLAIKGLRAKAPG